MNTPHHHDPQQPDVFLGSTQTPPSRPPLTSKDSKRVCFYKSGDPQFSGHWVVINSRTFKTFDALLDALSNKVPLPFGVRTITTPKGTHTIRSLDDLQHGASYVCSDQRKVKPLNLDEINRRHVPWNSNRPTSTGRQGRRGLIRQLVKKNEVGRMAKIAESSVTVRTPKRLVVFKNRDPSTKRTVVLQRRRAPTFEALLEYLSQVMQFPVVKLYTDDGRRVDGLQALILCSGVIVAAGNEPFQPVNFNLQASTQPSHSVISESTGPTKTKPFSQVQQKLVRSRSRSRNFSLSSERYFINQINMSMNGSHSEENEVKKGSCSPINRAPASEEIEKCDFTSGIEEKDRSIIPTDDQIEKSFRVNPDGSMTVEMKVRLTIKQEEMIQWSTTVSRACVNNQEMAAFAQPVSTYDSPDNKDNDNSRTRELNIDDYGFKDEYRQTYKSIKFNKEAEDDCGRVTSEPLENPKPRFRRLPTPGPGLVRKKETSVENIKRLSQTEVQESTVGTYSYVEHTAEGELLEGYRVVSRSSSSSSRPIPKPRKKKLGEAKHNKTHSSVSGMAEVLQLHNKGKEITESVMHIYQSQDTCQKYFAKTWADEDNRFELMSQEHKTPDSTESGPRSSSNNCDTDLTKSSVSSGSGKARNNKLLSSISGQSDNSQTVNINASSFTDNKNLARCESSEKGVETFTKEWSKSKRVLSKKTKMAQTSERSNKYVPLKSTVTNKKEKGGVPDYLKDLKNSKSSESQSCTESDKYGQKVKKRKKGQSPKKVNTCQSDMLRDTSQNINVSRTDMLKPQMKETLDIIPSSHSVPIKILAKQRSVNGSITKFPKMSKELSESVSMPVLHSSPCNIHQYVENWLENIQPESVPYMDEFNQRESRAEFQCKSDVSNISSTRSELDKANLLQNCPSFEGSTIKKPVSQRQIRYEGEVKETKNMRRSCKSMPSLRIYTAEQETATGKNKSSEDLDPKLPDAGGETSTNTRLNPRSGMKDVLEQFCLSIWSIRTACSHSHLSSLKKKKKSSSLPDFSSQLASDFGSPSKALLSFLTLMTLKDGIANSANEDFGSANANNSGTNPEALQVMQSIQKLASIEDEEELKARLAHLHSSTSAQLKKSWRDFQEKNNIKESHPLSPRQSVQEFALEVNSEEDNQEIFGLREVMDKLNMCQDLSRDISSRVRGDLTNFKRAKPIKEQSGHENVTTSFACANEDANMKDDLGGFLEDKRGYSKEQESQYADITNTKPADLSQEFEESSHKPALLSKELAMEESDMKNVQIEDMTKPKGLLAYITEIVDDVKTCQEMYADNEPSKADLCEEKQDMNNVQITEDKYTDQEMSQVDEFQVPDYSTPNLEDKVQWQENVACMQAESERVSPTLEIEAKDIRSNSQVSDNTVRKMGDCTDSLEGCGRNANEEDNYYETREHPKQPDIIPVDSETETVKGHLPNINIIQTEDKKAIHKDTGSEASDFSVDEADPNSNNENVPKEVESNNGHEETICSTSECENPAAKLYHFPVSDQESETEHELHKSEEESVAEKQAHNANEDNKEADEDEDEDFDAESNSPLHLHQEGKYSDHSESYKGQEVVVELDLQTLEEECFSKYLTHPAGEKYAETDEHEDKQRNAFNTDKDLDAQSYHCYLEGPSNKDFGEAKHKAQSEDSAGIEEAVMDHECQYVHPAVFPQQLLDFLNLALMSSALIFTYDANGCLRIEPDRCKNRAMSLSESNADNRYARRCLPSPNTSDLSDYRPDTSESGGELSQVSTDLLTESGEEETERLFMCQGNMKQSSDNSNREVKSLDNDSKKPHPETKQRASINSLSSFPDSTGNSTVQDPVSCNSTDSVGNSEIVQCLAFHAKTDIGEGILIDKGRWLLKENHLIRKSPPVPIGMYEHVDTTSVDTGPEDTSEDAPYIPCGRKQSPLAVISSSELEDMAKPSTPKCTYFNMAHSSDSDPFLDNQSIASNRGRGFTRKSKEVSPLGEPSKMLAKKNGSLYSFPSVEFKLAAGKVHPEDGTASTSVVEKSARSQSLRCNTPHEEESVEGLSLRCWQHCPIL